MITAEIQNYYNDLMSGYEGKPVAVLNENGSITVASKAIRQFPELANLVEVGSVTSENTVIEINGPN